MRRISAFLGLLLLCGTAMAQQAYPNRPLRMVIPWPPGQATDLVGRVVAQKLSEVLGQQVGDTREHTTAGRSLLTRGRPAVVRRCTVENCVA